MNKDLHDIDDLFRSGLDSYEVTPSAGVKERLDAELDKKNAESYKKRLIGWKRTALLLLLLLTGFIIYETGLLKIGSGHPGERTADKQMNDPFGQKHEEALQNNIVPGNTNDKTRNDDAGSYNKEAIKNDIGNTGKTTTGDDHIPWLPTQKEITVPVTAGIYNKARFKNGPSGNKIAVQKNNPEKEQPTPLAGVEKKETPGIHSDTDKDINGLLKTIYILPTEKMNPPRLKRENDITKITGKVANSIKQLQAINDSVLKISTAKKSKEKKREFFKPFWMMTGFASYDQAGYQLDSDEPSAITSLKYREAHEPSFSSGFLLTCQLTNCWGLQSGVIYSNTAIGMKPQKTYAFRDPTGDVAYKYITSSGYAFIKPGFGPQPLVGDSLTTAEAKHTIENITVPLAIKYTVSEKKISVTPGAGIEANFITKANLEVEISDTVNSEIVIIRKLKGTKSFYWSFVADAELRYNINKKLSLTVRPVYRHAISPITKNNVVETFPRSFGLGAGVTIKF